MRTFQVLENTTMYDPSLHHLRLNILGSFNVSSDDFGLSHHRDYFPLNSILYLPFQMWHSLDTCHIMGPVEPQSPVTSPSFWVTTYFHPATAPRKGNLPHVLSISNVKRTGHTVCTLSSVLETSLCVGAALVSILHPRAQRHRQVQ